MKRRATRARRRLRKKRKKKTRVKLRIPIAPPGKRHKSLKDYDRKREKKVKDDD